MTTSLSQELGMPEEPLGATCRPVEVGVGELQNAVTEPV